LSSSMMRIRHYTIEKRKETWTKIHLRIFPSLLREWKYRVIEEICGAVIHGNDTQSRLTHHFNSIDLSKKDSEFSIKYSIKESQHAHANDSLIVDGSIHATDFFC
jgi:hypothetical protein